MFSRPHVLTGMIFALSVKFILGDPGEDRRDGKGLDEGFAGESVPSLVDLVVTSLTSHTKLTFLKGDSFNEPYNYQILL